MSRHILLFALLFTLAFCVQSQDIPSNPVHFFHLEEIDGLQTKDGEVYSGEAYFIKETGQPVMMRSFVEGKREGVWRSWHADGKLYKEGDVKDQKENGRYREYYENGTLRNEEFYALGLKTGTWTEYQSDGKLIAEKSFSQDKLHGKVIFYDREGKVKVTEEYVEGRNVSSDRFKSQGGVTITKTVSPAKID